MPPTRLLRILQRIRPKPFLPLALAAAFVLAPHSAPAQSVRPDFYIANGTVNAELLTGDTLYVGGSFTALGPPTGAGVPIDPGTGLTLPGYPRVVGQVLAAISDGSGGWFIGGSFTQVGGLARANLAHILSDLSVDVWDPGTNGAVRALARAGGTLYVAGSFTTVGGQSRNRIAAVHLGNGAVSAWDPNASGQVNALAVNGTVVYAGGVFTSIGGQPRNRIAALDTTTGLATAWDANANSTVLALAIDGGTVYAAGTFTAIGGQPRNRIAALDAGALATPWNPNANSTVSALAVSGGVVYMGGSFLTVSGMVRNRLAAVDAESGGLTSWNPSASSQVLCLAAANGVVYLGGDFTITGTASRSRIAALDPVTGIATGWNPSAFNTVNTIAVDGAVVYAGGTFNGMGGVVRNNLAAIDVRNGQATGWDPNVDGAVQALAAAGGAIVAGGQFGTAGGQPRSNLVALDRATALATSWNPSPNGQVSALALDGSVLYVGGLFTQVGGQPRANLAALDVASGSASAWNPGANDQIFALALRSNTVLAGGQFTTLGGQARNRVGAVDATTGAATAWNPNVNGTVRALSAACDKVILGGFFTFVGPSIRNYIAMVDAGTGATTAWNPNPNGPVFTTVLRGPTLYAGGVLSLIGGQNRNRIAALSVATGNATAWNPNADGVVRALAVSDTAVYAGGSFTAMGGLGQAGVAGTSADASLPCPTIVVSPAIAPDGRAGTSYSATFTASGGTGPYCWTFSGALPPGLAFNAGTVSVSGTPADTGLFVFTLQATDVAGCGAIGTYALRVRPACPTIVILPAALDTGRVAVAYAETLTTSAGTAPFTWSIVTGAPPAGVTLAASSGVLSGMPTAAGTASFTVRVVDANLCETTRSYALHVRPACTDFAIAPPVAANGVVGQPYTQSLSASGAVPPLAWSVASGALPAGVTLNPTTGVLGGTPEGAGLFNFVVAVRDSNGCSAERGYTLAMFATAPTSTVAANTAGRSVSVLNPCARIPVVFDRGEATPTLGISVTFQLDTAKLALCTPAHPESSIALGTWLGGDPGVLQVIDQGGGTYTVDQVVLGDCGPTQGGELFTIDLASADGDGAGAITIVAVNARDCSNQPIPAGPGAPGLLTICNTPLVFVPASLPDGTVGEAYATGLHDLSGSPPLSWSVVHGSLPAGLALASGTGALTGVPTTPGTSTFTIAMSDSNGCGAERGYTVTVFPAAPVSHVAADVTGLSLSSEQPCVTVPFVLQRGESTPARAISVTFQVDTTKLALCDTPAASIHPGTWLDAFPGHLFQVTGEGGGWYTVDLAILGEPCGVTAGGTLFSVDLQAVATSGAGAITVTAVHARDCGNTPFAVGPGAPALLPICNAPLAFAPSSLPDGTTGSPYSASLTALSGTAPFTWTVVSGGLPDGLALGAGTGAITGTPATPGTANFTIRMTDTYGCGTERSYTVSVLAAPSQSTVAADVSGLCLSPVHTCVSVPVVLQRAESAPALGISVTFRVDTTKIALCGTPAASIHQGGWLAGFPDNTFQVTDDGAGYYTVDQAILGSPCGATTGGTLFSVDLHATGGDGTGVITVTAVHARDCANVALPIGPGAPGLLSVHSTPPGAIADLAAAAVTSGNGADSTLGIAITFTPPSGTVALYRAPFGVYPRYDRDGPVSAPATGTLPGAPWQLVTAAATSGMVDHAPRGFWYYAALVTDSCGLVSTASNMTPGTLNYLLGDVSNGLVAGRGNDRVLAEDISLLGAFYGISGAPIDVQQVAYLDVGPTVDFAPTSRPRPDKVIDLEDLVLFSIDFGISAQAPALAAHTAPRASGRSATPASVSAVEAFQLSAPATGVAGDTVWAIVGMTGGGTIQAFSARLAWNTATVQPVTTTPGTLVGSQGGILLVPKAGTVDGALLGVGPQGMTGSGEVARIGFRVIQTGACGITLPQVVARDATNHNVAVTIQSQTVGVGDAPLRTAMAQPSPNPLRASSSIGFSLAEPSRVDLAVYAVDGRRVRTLAAARFDPGVHRLAWDGRDDAGHTVPAGVYFVRLDAAGRRWTRSLVVMR